MPKRPAQPITAPVRTSVIPKLYTTDQVSTLQSKYVALLAFNLDTTDRFNTIANLLEGLQAVYGAVGTGDKFRAYLISRNMHANLLAQLDSLNSLANEAVSSALIAEAPEQYVFNKFVYDVAALCRDVQAGKANANTAIEHWISEHQTNFARNAAVHFRQLVAPGGQPEKPQVEALYKIGYSIWQRHKASNTVWQDTRRDINAILQAVIADGTATDDQRLVWQAWHEMTDNAIRRQLRNVFSKALFAEQGI